MMITFALLALAICCVWLPSPQLCRKFSIELWLVFFVLAMLAGLANGYLKFASVGSLCALLLFACLGTRRNASRPQRMVFGFLSALLALLMAMHRLPEFSNPVLWPSLELTPDAAPFTLFANFDKGAAGLVLLAFFCRRSAGIAEFGKAMRKACLVIVVTIICVMATATAMHYVRPDFKLSADTGVFLLVNFFFAVIAEEAFFRGLIQDRLALSLAKLRHGKAIAVVVSALLFGAAHLAGGMTYAGLTTLAGVGYAVAYARTERIEGPIAAHFLLNAVHFIGFTYPFIR